MLFLKNLKKMMYISLATLSIFLVGCTPKVNEPMENKSHLNVTSYQNTVFESYMFPDNFNMEKYKDVKLDFIVENNLYGSFLLQESKAFTKLTGIEVNIRPIDYDTLAQKINLDFISHEGNYDLIYVDPYQTLSKFTDYLEPLNTYINGENGAMLQSDIEDYYNYQLESTSFYQTDSNYYAIPFDVTSLVMFYRKDIFEDYKDAFYQEKGYDWTPTQDDFTWEKYIEVSQWIDKNVGNDVVSYGTGEMALSHNSQFCEVLALYYSYADQSHESLLLGTNSTHEIQLDEDILKVALDTYEQMIDNSHPESIHWQWSQSADAFSKNEIAMMLNWDENYYLLSEKMIDRKGDKIGIAPLPLGSNGRKSLYGGSGIGINKDSSQLEKEAAWFYITWATSPYIQQRLVLDTKGKFMTSLKSVNTQARLFDEHYYTVLYPIVAQNRYYYRPKIDTLYELEKIMNTHSKNVLNGKESTGEASQRIVNEWENSRNTGDQNED